MAKNIPNFRFHTANGSEKAIEVADRHELANAIKERALLHE